MTPLLQDALFDTLPAAPSAKAKPQLGHPAPPRRDPEHRAAPCNPTCLVCGNPEPPEQPDRCETCPAVPGRRCATLCDHVAQPYKTDVCLITTRVDAEILTSPHSGHTIAATTCPHCGERHSHSPNPGTHYRVGQCGQPYIVHTPERST